MSIICDQVKWSFKKAVHRVHRSIFPPNIPKNSEGKILVHLGCGNRHLDAYINVDMQPSPHIHQVATAYPLYMFKSNFVDLIYA